MAMLKIGIIEDEILASRRLERMIKKSYPDFEVVARMDSLESCFEFFKNEPELDLLFADIKLGDGETFELFEKYPTDTPVIFTTAYDQFAIDAFHLLTVDYLLKPIKIHQLQNAIEKFLHHFKSTPKVKSNEIKTVSDGNSRHLVKIGHRFRVIPYSEVAYYYIENKIVYLKSFSSKKLPLNYTLEELEEMISPTAFFRINRQMILNYHAIKKMTAASKSRLQIEVAPPFNEKIFSSTSRSGQFKEWLKGHSLL